MCIAADHEFILSVKSIPDNGLSRACEHIPVGVTIHLYIGLDTLLNKTLLATTKNLDSVDTVCEVQDKMSKTYA